MTEIKKVSTLGTNTEISGIVRSNFQYHIYFCNFD
jgi:hypothetical protein